MISAIATYAAGDACAQVSFYAGDASIDSFPIVKVPLDFTESRMPANAVNVANLRVTEDANSVTGFTLEGCSGSQSAAIAFVIDTSSSMQQSIGYGTGPVRSYAAFNASITTFLAHLSAASRIAIVPFSDSATYSYPGSASWFFSNASSGDSVRILGIADAFHYGGAGTDVDAGIMYGVEVLKLASEPIKAIVLVTDDAVTEPDSLLVALADAHIALYIMQVAHDTIPYAVNAWLASRTGGAYYGANDSSLYASSMAAIADRIVGEHCTLRYVSSDPCPWWKSHDIAITLNYKSNKLSAHSNYSLGSTYIDVHAPSFAITAPTFVTREVAAYDPFPCESGLRATNAILHNFQAVSGTFTSDSVRGLFRVIDSLHLADGDYFAVDSSGNEGSIHFSYVPKPDTTSPRSLLDTSLQNVFIVKFSEVQPWDRGLRTVHYSSLQNLAFDSLVETRDSASLYLRRLDPTADYFALIDAEDSAGNRTHDRLEQVTSEIDTLPPIIVQDAQVEPRVTLSAAITEERARDLGIRSVRVATTRNCSLPSIVYTSRREAEASVHIDDSLVQASAAIDATDSAGNHSNVLLVYTPSPDVLPPIVVTQDTGPHYHIIATDTQAWDRGVRSLYVLAGWTNVIIAKPVYIDRTHASIDVTVIDTTADAVFSVVAEDSAANVGLLNLRFAARAKAPGPLEDEVIDFGTVSAGATADYVRTTIEGFNNSVQLNVDIPAPTGDDSVFSLEGHVVTFVIGPQNSEVLHFHFHPRWIGNWKAVYSLVANGTVLRTITLLGQSVGTIGLSLDTVLVLHDGATATMHLSLDAAPKPINLDSIAFTLAYDQDVISLGEFASCPAGSLDTGICLYDTKWMDAEHTQVQMIRRTKSASATLSYDESVLSIPVLGYLAKVDSTPVHIVSVTSGRLTSFQAKDGLVRVGDTCGSTIGRAVMRGEATIAIDGIVPNPASSSAMIRLRAVVAAGVQLKIVDMLGHIVLAKQVRLEAGSNQILLDELPRAGVYSIVVAISDGVTARKRLDVVR